MALETQTLIDGATLIDYKVTSVWTHIYQSRIEEWTAQGNVNRWLAVQNSVDTIKELKNVLILRDWSRRDAQRMTNYPAVQVIEQPLKLWSIEAAEAYVRERVLMHQKARASADTDLLECTDEERWHNDKTGKDMRCEAYCPAAAFCSQRKKYLENLDGRDEDK